MVSCPLVINKSNLPARVIVNEEWWHPGEDLGDRTTRSNPNISRMYVTVKNIFVVDHMHRVKLQVNAKMSMCQSSHTVSKLTAPYANQAMFWSLNGPRIGSVSKRKQH